MIDPPETIESTSTRRRIPSSASRPSTPMWKKEARNPPPDSARPILTSAAWGSAVGTTAVLLELTIPPSLSAVNRRVQRLGGRGGGGPPRPHVFFLNGCVPPGQG